MTEPKLWLAIAMLIAVPPAALLFFVGLNGICRAWARACDHAARKD